MTEHERYSYALRVRCPLCQANYYRDCQAVAGQPVGMVQRNYRTGVVGMHHERESSARMLFAAEMRKVEALERHAKLREADEQDRTCPWCGFLASCQEDLLEHEAGCE